MGTNLILSSLGVEHGEEHVPVAISLLLISGQDLTEGRWRRLRENEWSGSVDIHSAMNTNLFEKPTSGCEDSDRGHWVVDQMLGIGVVMMIVVVVVCIGVDGGVRV
jgi:hypothetical protein